MKGFNFLLELKNGLQFKKMILLAILFFVFSNNTFANDPSPREEYLRSEIKENSFGDAGWKNAIDGIDYSREVIKKKKKKEEDEHPEPDEEDEDERAYDNEDYIEPPDWGSFMTNFFKFLMILIGVVIVGFIIANFIGADGFTGRPSNKKVKTKTGPITLENVEENIHESDLDKFLKEALAKEDYTQAVRLYYLAIIKELSLNKWIKWKKDKTNRDYSRELSDSNFKDSFREVTRIFERVWYGNKELGGMDFRTMIQPKFQNLLETVKGAGRKL